MLKSCKYCGRIHDARFHCKQRVDADRDRWAKRKDEIAQKFRNSVLWKNKRKQVLQRQNYICACCAEEMEGTLDRLNTEDIQVHHIVPIQENYDRRLDDSNLIGVCALHHEMCESGRISRKKQREIVEKYLRV